MRFIDKINPVGGGKCRCPLGREIATIDLGRLALCSTCDNAKRCKQYRRDQELKHLSHVRIKYDLSSEEYTRLVLAQNGVCAVCGKTTPGQRNLDVDHDHTTGEIRGLLCRKCNTALGLFQENSLITDKATVYLRRFGR